jgi:hypothetical protein
MNGGSDKTKEKLALQASLGNYVFNSQFECMQFVFWSGPAVLTFLWLSLVTVDKYQDISMETILENLSCSAGLEILHLLCNQNAHYHINTIPPMIPTLSQMNPVHTPFQPI